MFPVRDCGVFAFEVATWNTDWITAGSARFDQARARVEELDADVLARTEVTTDLLPDDGHVALGGEDWGYPIVEVRRKVALWSTWLIYDEAWDLLDPPGRHAAATLGSPSGPLRIHAVCIPWRDAHVQTGRGDSGPWLEHLRFLDSLSALLASERSSRSFGPLPRIVLGDVNQRGGPRPYRSETVRRAWDELLVREGLSVCSPDNIIDKIALGKGLTAGSIRALPPDGISDHHSVAASVVLK